MQTLPGKRALYSHLKGVRGDLSKQLKPVIGRMQAVLTRYGETIPLDQRDEVLAETSQILSRFFVGSDGRNPYRNGVVPLSPYARLLNKHIVQVTADVVLAHYRWMKRVTPPDIFGWLSTAGVPVAELRSNPLARYEPAHTWVDPSGYTLSRRIWQSGERTRAKMDAMLDEGIRQGTGSLPLSRKLEQFLLPERAHLRTLKPYGTDASFDAMRLARTEISRAHAHASLASAYGNPFVDSWDWALSARHPKYDICDQLATIGMDGSRLRPPYKLGEEKVPVDDSHPQCICNGRPGVSGSLQPVIEELRGMLSTGQAAPLTPASPYAFLVTLLGTFLADQANLDERRRIADLEEVLYEEAI